MFLFPISSFIVGLKFDRHQPTARRLKTGIDSSPPENHSEPKANDNEPTNWRT